MNLRAIIGACMLAALGGCVNIERGATMVNVRTGSRADEKLIRRTPLAAPSEAGQRGVSRPERR